MAPDRAIYESEVPRPQVPALLVAARRLGPYTLAEFVVCPVRYHPRQSRLELIARLELTLSHEAPEAAPEPPQADYGRAYVAKMADRVRRIVINPEDVDLFGPYPDIVVGIPRSRPTSQVEHVIITNHNLAGSFERLSRWRNQFGTSSRVVLTSDILANQVPGTGSAMFNRTSGYYDGGTRDAAEAIRNFIKWVAVHWNTDFVLLGGDTDVVPERHALGTLEGKLYSGGDFADTDLHSPFGSRPQASSELPGSPATNVVDDQATTWECTAGDTNPWIRLEMSPRRPVNKVTLSWGATHASGYVLAVSRDGTNWTDIHTTTAGAAGTVEIGFPPVMATFVRLQVTSGTGFALEKMSVYGPPRNHCVLMPGGTATRVHLQHQLNPNPGNDPWHDRVLFYDGPFAGAVIPYDENSNDAVLGWHFIDDLLASSPTVSSTSTPWIEIRGPASNHGHTLVMATESLNLIPADLYYGDLAAAEYPPSTEHDWDPDRNLVYGEQYGGALDGVNGLPDVYVGRAPVASEADATVFVDKVIRYERYVDQADHRLPPDFAVSVLLGSENWYEPDPATLDDSAAGKEDIRQAYLAGAPGKYLFTRRYQDHANVPAADQGPDLEIADTGRIVAGIQLPSNAISLTSHGSPEYLCYLNTNQVRALAGPPGIWYANACLTNMFDVTPGRCLGEEAILNQHGGAVGYVGNTRFGRTGDNPFELAFWAEMLRANTLGEMFAACKQTCDNAWPQYALNLLGDPAMRVWSDRPVELEIGIRPFELCVKSDNWMHISVYSVDPPTGPVPDAVVVVSQNGAPLARATTGRSGEVRLSVHPTRVGEVDVAVFGESLIPSLRQCPVITCNP